PATLKAWRIWANKYTTAIWTPGTTAAREFIMCGTLYVPSWLSSTTTNELGLIQGNANADGDTTARNCFRYCLGNQGPQSANAWQSAIISGNLTEQLGGSSNNAGMMELVAASPTDWTGHSTGGFT